MSYLAKGLAADIRLFNRATLGALIGLAALLALAWAYGMHYGTDDLPMATFLARASLVLGAPFVGEGILSAFAIHLLRERRG